MPADPADTGDSGAADAPAAAAAAAEAAASRVDVRFDRYYRYDDLTRILHQFAERHPDLVRLESIGRSHEGRDIWVATVTSFATGPDAEKPALWVDGSIHATELAPSSALLYLLHTLVTQFPTDPEVRRCLETRAFYVCPRVNPDGAECALADRPKLLRSSTRPYPYDEEPRGGLYVEDVDGDGHIRAMRLVDPNGPWKACPEDPRLLARRDPTEVGGTYYRVFPEGRVHEYDGLTIDIQHVKQRLDLNRNFPANWRQEHQQRGAGPYPASEPEVGALVRFVSRHPNITGGVAFHTQSGVILRPFSHQSDEQFPAEDLWTYQKIGQKGTDLTGYPNVSVYHDFRYHPKEVITGAFDDWAYEHLGIFGWTVELWSPQRHAGIPTEGFKFIDWYREHPLEDDLKLLRWSDEALGGQGCAAWRPFDHPDLGPVELGGWDALYAFGNPPPALLEREIAPFPEWLVWHCLISPKLELYRADATLLGEGAYRVRLVVHNTGWLPTYVTKHALESKLVRGVVCEIELPEGATLETGKHLEERGQLEGRAYKPSAATRRAADPTDDRLKVEWVVRAPAGSTVRLLARHERAGVVRAEVSLP
jgi:murein tripeptide amidase MpaA